MIDVCALLQIREGNEFPAGGRHPGACCGGRPTGPWKPYQLCPFKKRQMFLDDIDSVILTRVVDEDDLNPAEHPLRQREIAR